MIHLARIAQHPLSLTLVSMEGVPGNEFNELGVNERVFLAGAEAHISNNQGILRVFARRRV